MPLPTVFIRQLDGHQGPVRAVRFNVNGNYCVTCGGDKFLKLWNPYTGVQLKSYGGHGYEVLDATASDDSARIASCSADRTVILWDVSTGQIVRKFRGHISRVNCVQFNRPDCSLVMSGSYDSTVRIWDTKSRNMEPVQILDEAKDSITSLHVSEHEILTGSVDCNVRRYDIRIGRMTADHIGQPVTSVTLSKDGQCVLVSSLDNTVRLLDKETGELLNDFKGHNNEKYKVDSCLSHTDSEVVSGSEDGRICFWDLIESKLVHAIEKAHKTTVYSLSYHPEQPIMLSASSDGKVKLWKDKAEEE
ncbi:WD repeat domain-containing 83 [Paramuricea clavata]|uniref:WD repeat domain-containing protein 83 n=1 Tax=Paramuricea clavata TaxID=317549 RepID=A0A6S7GE93_PARCT|nr:WD repeat domain-containing 83 [Paramuricea clavata]